VTSPTTTPIFNQFSFYEKPLLQGNTKNALPVEFLNNIAIERNMSAINFGRDDSNSS
jgi:hypothetical protein